MNLKKALSVKESKKQLFFLTLDSCLWQGLCVANDLQRTLSQTDNLSFLKEKLHRSTFSLYLN